MRFGPVAYPVTTNPAPLTQASLPALNLAMGGKTMVIPKVAGLEDFSEFQKVVPGFFYFLGAPPRGKEFAKAPPNTLRCSTLTKTTCPPAHAAWPRWPWTFCSADEKEEERRRAPCGSGRAVVRPESATDVQAQGM